MNRKFARIACWGALLAVFVFSLAVSMGHWQGMLNLQPHVLIWLVFLMIVLWEAGYWFGEERPQVVQVADLNAVRTALEGMPALVREEVGRAVTSQLPAIAEMAVDKALRHWTSRSHPDGRPVAKLGDLAEEISEYLAQRDDEE